MRIPRASGLVALFLCAVASTLGAQDTLRVLRFAPQGVAAANENVFITFDHPVAPKLDESVKAASVVSVNPAVPMRVYWQDPSTIVVRFDNLWKPGATYRVSLNPRLRSADALPLAMSDSVRVVRVAPVSILQVWARMRDGFADTLVQVAVLTDGPVPNDWLRGRARLVMDAPTRNDTIPLVMVGVRATARRDDGMVPYNRDRRLDSLQRIVELVATRALPRGAAGHIEVQAPESKMQHRPDVLVRPPFGVRQPVCSVGECRAGPLYLRFTDPVPASEIRAHVRVNGTPPAIGGDSSTKTWAIVAQLMPRRTYQIEIEAGLHSTEWEQLPRSVGELVRVPPRAPSVTYVSGSYVVPSDDSTLLTIRHVNTDSVLVIIGRVRAEQRERAVRSFQNYWVRATPPLAWRTTIADSVVLRYATPLANDSTGTLALPVSHLPNGWGVEAPVVVRAVGLANADAVEGNRTSFNVGASPGAPPEVAFAVLRRSPLALHLHDTPGDLRAWVTTLRDTRGVEGARVRLVDTLGREVARGTTDARGMVRLRYATRGDVSSRNMLVEARHGEDVALQALQHAVPFAARAGGGGDDDDAVDWYGRPESSPGLHGAAFTERGIYRPGETVYLKGVVRRFTPADGYHVTHGDSARWTVRRADTYQMAERVWSRISRLSEFGTVVDTFVVPRTARLGRYSASLAVHDAAGWHNAATTYMSVAEYRVPEFSISATADTMRQWFAGESVPVGVAARYLYGVPMQGARGSWWAQTKELSPWEASVHGLEGWIVGRPWWMVPGGHEESSYTSAAPLTTGPDGRVTLPVRVMPLTRPGRVTVYTQVADANRQTVSTQTSFTAHAADVYVGARLPDRRWYETVGQPVHVQLLAVDAEGRRRAGTSIHVYALRREWAASRTRPDTVLRTQIISSTDTIDFQFTPTTAGLHELLFVARDARGRESQTGVNLWVFDARSRRVTSAELTVTLDKPRYAPGDTLVARVLAPEAGSALVTLSHEGILSQSVVPLVEGANVVRVAIPENALPSAKLTVFALRTTRPNDPTRSYFRQAMVNVTVARDSKVLQVAVIPDRTRYQPRDTVRLSLRVRDHGGHGLRSEVAVWALDEGVALLTDYLKPDVLSDIMLATGDPSSFVTTLSSMIPALTWWNQAQGQIRIRGASLSLMSNVVSDVGELSGRAAGASVAAAAVRQRFTTTPFYRGAIVTDAAGRAQTSFVLPDNITTFRLFAVAVDETVRAGSADTAIVSARTLAVRAALPRVLRAEDTLLAGAVITQDRDGRAPVSLRAEGSGVQLAGASLLMDTLVGRTPRELRFSLSGITGDTATLRFFGRTNRDADAVEARLPVSPSGHPRARVTMGTLNGSAQVAFALDEALDPTRSRLELQLGNSAVPLLQRLSESLRLYPYYCTEQISSTGHVLIARLRAEEMLVGASRLAARDRAQLETAVATLVQRQRDDGGIGYWSGTNWTTPWLTAYALRFLDEARRAGIDVPPATRARAREYLVDVGHANNAQLRAKLAAGEDSSSYAREQLAAAMGLRRTGMPDTLGERRVVSLAHRLDWTERLTLAQLLVLRGDSAGARILVENAWRATRREGRRIVVDDSVAPRYWLFRSIVRPVTALLSATAAVTPNDPRLEPLFESLIQTGQPARFSGWNTIDQTLVADAVVAMLARPSGRGSTTVTVSSGANTVATSDAGANRSDTVRVPLARVARAERGDTVRLSLAAEKPTMPVYYAATLLEVPRARPVRADDEGISVERWYERYDELVPIVSAREGELVRVRIRITVPADREFVVVDDPLPAGLEAVDLSLRTSAALPPYEGAPRLKAEQDAEGPPGQRYLFGSWDAGWWTPWEHRELRDDRVLYFARQLWKGSYLVSYVARATSAGTFVRPPAHAEEMYNPALHGRSDGGWFTVTPVK